ncbi:ATP-binding protein [Candidatus Entotheonella palauensis]|nr:hypothetical protein [Candidatus Entotheonella palauensis]
MADDLHWADQPTLELLAHLVFTATQAAEQHPVPMLILSAYRPEEDRPRLVRSIQRLQREEHCETVTLTGLDEADIDDLIRHMCQGRPSSQLLDTIRDITHGNPLFIQETLYHLEQQQALCMQDGDLVTTAAAEAFRLPEHLTSVIRERIDGLSVNCRRVLTLAACLGERFSFDTLARASELNEDDLLDLLEEGLEQRLLINTGPDFQFAHALICQAFYHLPSVRRRQRLHGQIAEALEQLHESKLDTAFSQIASHLVRAGSAAKAEKLIHYGCQAGDDAFAAFDWSLAAHYYNAVLTTAEAVPAAGELDWGSLYYRAGLSHCNSGDYGLGLGLYDRAIEAYQTTGDLEGQGEALIRKALRQASGNFGTLIDLQPLEDLLERLGGQATRLRGRIITTLSVLYWTGRQGETAAAMAQRALEIGEEVGDALLCATASFHLALAQVMNLDIATGLKSYQLSQAYAQQAQSRWKEGLALQRMATALVLLGHFTEVDAVAAEAHLAAAETNNWGQHSLTLSALASSAVAQGDFDRAEDATSKCMVLVARYRFPYGGALALPAVACARAWRGLWEEADRALDMLVQPGVVFERPRPTHQTVVSIYRQLVRKYAEGYEPSDVEFGALVQGTLEQEPLDVSFLPAYCALVELCASQALQVHLTDLYDRLTQVSKRDILFSRGWVFFIPRMLGLAARVCHGEAQAEIHFQQAIEIAASLNARPALGRSCLDYAHMIVDGGRAVSRPQARELAERAHTIFNELGMQPFAKQAKQLVDMLQRETPALWSLHDQKCRDLTQEEIEVVVAMISSDLYFAK